MSELGTFISCTIVDIDGQSFTPELPEDLIIEFNIVKSSILCSVFSLEYKQAATGQTNLNKFLTKAKTTSRVEYAFLFLVHPLIW